MRTLALKRLDPGDPMSWALWPTLEARVLEWVPKLTPRTSAEKVVWHARKLWATAPLCLGAWLVQAPGDNGHGPATIAHFLGWVTTDDFGESWLLIYHACVDPGESIAAVWPVFVQEMARWRLRCNEAATRQGRTEEWIRYGKFFTDRHGPAWERLLGRYAQTEPLGTVETVDLASVRLDE